MEIIRENCRGQKVVVTGRRHREEYPCFPVLWIAVIDTEGKHQGHGCSPDGSTQQLDDADGQVMYVGSTQAHCHTLVIDLQRTGRRCSALPSCVTRTRRTALRSLVTERGMYISRKSSGGS